MNPEIKDTHYLKIDTTLSKEFKLIPKLPSHTKARFCFDITTQAFYQIVDFCFKEGAEEHVFAKNCVLKMFPLTGELMFSHYDQDEQNRRSRGVYKRVIKRSSLYKPTQHLYDKAMWLFGSQFTITDEWVAWRSDLIAIPSGQQIWMHSWQPPGSNQTIINLSDFKSMH
jgi:hypothetical protein